MKNNYVFVRHGESVYNAELKHQGWAKGIDLTTLGIEQAEQIGMLLKNKVAVDFIVSSTLLRARKTARIINKYLDKKLYFRAGLRDYRRSSKFEGLHYSLYIDDPEYIEWKHWTKVDKSFSLDKGESIADFERRILGVIDALEKKNEGKTILVVTHNDVIQTLLERLSELKISKEDIQNCSNFFLNGDSNTVSVIK